MRRIIETISTRLNSFMVILGVITLLIVVVASSLQVFSRYVLGSSISWTEECARYAFIWASCCGATIAMKNGTLATVSVLSSLFKGKARTIHSALIQFLILLCGFMLTYQGVRMVMATTTQLSTALRMPMAIVYAAVPVMGVVFIFHALNGIVSCFTTGDLVKEEA